MSRTALGDGVGSVGHQVSSGSVSVPDFHYGLHLSGQQAEVESVRWERSLPRADRVRVRAFTCACQSPVFELCTAGGLWFVRCLSDENPAAPLESEWMPAKAGNSLWLRILNGQAR